ncbi:MAG: endonuclease MutS2 [Thermodesulfovibrionales bacterium]|nr:endonuclease MutS2 [Thermodesulfovibrionales bacterium]
MVSSEGLELLEFNKLLSEISEIAKSPATKRAIINIHPFKDLSQILERQVLIKEMLSLYRTGDQLPISDLPDLIELFQKLKPEGAIIEGKELYKFLVFFEITSEILEHIKKSKNIPSLKAMIYSLTGFPEIEKIISRSIDREGYISDHATERLFEIRTEARRLTAKIKKRLQELMDDPNITKYLQDNYVTQRSGRWVIPVRMDSKGQIAGVVHDVSNTGQTAFIEPLAIIAISNELENILAEQKVEEIRILSNLTSIIRENLKAIKEEYDRVLYIDMLNCITYFSYNLNMEIPSLTQDNKIKIDNARHPLLTLSFKRSGGVREVVPLRVSLGGEKTVMVITGANAGGKTLAIKTIGLLHLMAMSGMPVPADPTSSFPILEDILIDIGDEQSIEANLSTFSAHIMNMSKIIEKAAPKRLVLIDEIGKGTDPDEGAALACAILNELKSRGCLVFATTHLSMIKVFVHKSEGMINASMEFDQHSYRPLYRLRIGEPGMSHAFETAKLYGLQDTIIANAKKLIGEQKFVLAELISDLNEKRQYYEEANLEIKRLQAELEDRNRLLEKKVLDIENSYNEILRKAYIEASRIVSEAKSEVNAIMAEAKRKSKESLNKLKAKQSEFEEIISKFKRDEFPKIDIEKIKEGDHVFVKSVRRNAIVLSKNLKLKQLKIKINGKDLIVPIEDITLPKDKHQEVEVSPVNTLPNIEVNNTLNVIGKRVDEALSQLETFLNKASLAGLKEVRIIHGIGKLILHKAIREYLKEHPLVKNFRSASLTEGGESVTIIDLV